MNAPARPGGSAPPPTDSSKTEIAQIAAAVTAVVGVLTGLAVTGILAQAQRNHGVWLLAAFSAVLAGAVLWIAATLLPRHHRRAARQRENFAWAQRLWRWIFRRQVLQAAALLIFGIGLGFAINALILTQRDTERPSVSAAFDQKTGTLTAHASAHGLSTDDRLVILVSGLTPQADSPTQLTEDPQSLYYAVIGPDQDGNVAHDVSVNVPTRYDIIGVKAWTGVKESECRTEDVIATKPLPQHTQAGCLLLRLR
jgi:hypothetical protein